MDAVEKGSIKSAGVSNFGVKHVRIFFFNFFSSRNWVDG